MNTKKGKNLPELVTLLDIALCLTFGVRPAHYGIVSDICTMEELKQNERRIQATWIVQKRPHMHATDVDPFRHYELEMEREEYRLQM